MYFARFAPFRRQNRERDAAWTRLVDFSDEGEVIRIGRTMLIIFAAGFPFLAARFILASFFQGLGRGFAAFVINFSYILLFAAPLALLLSRLIGLQGIWIGIVSGNLLSSAVGLASPG